MVLDATLLPTQHYKLRIKCKWRTGKIVAPFHMTQCCSYWKLSLQVTHNSTRPTYCLYTIINEDSPRGIVANTDYDIIGSKFEFQLHYHVPFWTFSSRRSIFSRESMLPPSDSAMHWPISWQSTLIPYTFQELFLLALSGSQHIKRAPSKQR